MNIILSHFTNSLPSFSFSHIFTYVSYAHYSLYVQRFEHFYVIALYKLNTIIINVIVSFHSGSVDGFRM